MYVDDKLIFVSDWLSIWCIAFFVDFGNVQIPRNLNVPPSLRMLGVEPQTKLNCEVLDSSQVRTISISQFTIRKSPEK